MEHWQAARFGRIHLFVFVFEMRASVMIASESLGGRFTARGFPVLGRFDLDGGLRT